MAETEQPKPDDDPAPIQDSDAERVTGEQAEDLDEAPEQEDED